MFVAFAAHMRPALAAQRSVALEHRRPLRSKCKELSRQRMPYWQRVQRCHVAPPGAPQKYAHPSGKENVGKVTPFQMNFS